MTTFEVESVTPLVKLSDSINPTRATARERIKSYRAKKSLSYQDPPPVGSKRRVYWAAHKNETRSFIERVRDFIERLQGNSL